MRLGVATIVSKVHYEHGLPVFQVPKAISGSELEPDSRLKTLKKYQTLNTYANDE
jgi:hypothetical protein